LLVVGCWLLDMFLKSTLNDVECVIVRVLKGM